MVDAITPKQLKDIHKLTQKIVVGLYEAGVISVDCKVREYDEEVIDWTKFWTDGDAKAAEDIIADHLIQIYTSEK